MPTAQHALIVVPTGDEIGELLELVRATRGQILERRLLAATLTTLAAWLNEQARLLGEPSDAEVDSPVRRLRAAPRRSRSDILTPREREVANCIARGYANRQIAKELVITRSTTERHVANMLNKLGMHSRAQIAVWVARQSF